MPYSLNMENIIIHTETRDMLPSISSTILHVRYSEHANSKSVQNSPIWRYHMMIGMSIPEAPHHVNDHMATSQHSINTYGHFLQHCQQSTQKDDTVQFYHNRIFILQNSLNRRSEGWFNI